MSSNTASVQRISHTARVYADCVTADLTPIEMFREIAAALETHTENTFGPGGCPGLPTPTGQWERWELALGAWGAVHKRCTPAEWHRICFGLFA